MLLHVLDYIAAPFGSQEYLLVQYGVQGRDWEPDANGNPILNKTGQADFASISTGAVSFFGQQIVRRYLVLYSAADPTFAKRIQDYQKILAPISTEDASLGLYSRDAGQLRGSSSSSRSATASPTSSPDDVRSLTWTAWSATGGAAAARRSVRSTKRRTPRHTRVRGSSAAGCFDVSRRHHPRLCPDATLRARGV